MRLAAFLLALIAATHYGPDLLAMPYADRAAAAKAFFYITRGIEGTLLFAVVARLSKNSVIIAICAWGAIEEAQTVACRISKPIAERPAYDLFTGMCGSHWYTAGLVTAALLAVYIVRRRG